MAPAGSSALGLPDSVPRQPEVPCSKDTEYHTKPLEPLGYCLYSDRNEGITFGLRGNFVGFREASLGLWLSQLV